MARGRYLTQLRSGQGGSWWGRDESPGRLALASVHLDASFFFSYIVNPPLILKMIHQNHVLLTTATTLLFGVTKQCLTESRFRVGNKQCTCSVDGFTSHPFSESLRPWRTFNSISQKKKSMRWFYVEIIYQSLRVWSSRCPLKQANLQNENDLQNPLWHLQYQTDSLTPFYTSRCQGVWINRGMW